MQRQMQNLIWYSGRKKMTIHLNLLSIVHCFYRNIRPNIDSRFTVGFSVDLPRHVVAEHCILFSKKVIHVFFNDIASQGHHLDITFASIFVARALPESELRLETSMFHSGCLCIVS